MPTRITKADMLAIFDNFVAGLRLQIQCDAAGAIEFSEDEDGIEIKTLRPDGQLGSTWVLGKVNKPKEGV